MSCKSYLTSSDRFFASQSKSAKPATHTFLCGGIAVLQNVDEYVEMYKNVVKDVIENDGRVCICENFPRITGTWPSRFYPPPHLLLRAMRFLRATYRDVPSYLLDAERKAEDDRINAAVGVSWDMCAFAMDWDFKEINGVWYLEDIIAAVRIVQQTLLDCGPYTRESKLAKANGEIPGGGKYWEVANCLVCIADHDGKLGVHLYFPYSTYYPEECMYLASICAWVLHEKCPMLPGCNRTWREVIDAVIYNGSLRIPLVQKAKRCQACENNSKKRKRCQACRMMGVIWEDRRYFPYVILHGNGEWNVKETHWIDPMVDFILRRPGAAKEMRAAHTRAPIPCLSERELAMVEAQEYISQQRQQDPSAQATLTLEQLADFMMSQYRKKPTVDKQRAAEFCTTFLALSSLRINTQPAHTRFFPLPGMPKPCYPRAWQHYFHSVLAAAQPPPQLLTLPLSTLEQLVRDARHGRMPPSPAPRLPPSNARSIPRPFAKPQPQPLPPPDSKDAKDGKDGTGGNDGKGVALDGRDAAVADLVKRLSVMRLQSAPWTNPGGAFGTANHTVTKDRESTEEKRMRSRYAHLLLTSVDDIQMAKNMATGLFAEYKDVETISNDPAGRCQLMQTWLREHTVPEYRQIQVLRMHISMKFKNYLVQVGGPGQHYCLIAGRIHRNCVVSFQLLRRGQVLQQHCFHSKCAGQHFNLGAITDAKIRLLFSPADTLGECAKGAPPETVALAKSLQKSSKALSSTGPKRTRRKTTKEHKATDEQRAKMLNLTDDVQSKFAPNAPPPLRIFLPDEPENAIAAPNAEPQADGGLPAPSASSASSASSGSSGMLGLSGGPSEFDEKTGCDVGEAPESPFHFSDCDDEQFDDEDDDRAKPPPQVPASDASASATPNAKKVTSAAKPTVGAKRAQSVTAQPKKKPASETTATKRARAKSKSPARANASAGKPSAAKPTPAAILVMLKAQSRATSATSATSAPTSTPTATPPSNVTPPVQQVTDAPSQQHPPQQTPQHASVADAPAHQQPPQQTP